MGKSPAKWIKAVLFGKKSSKSSLSKNVIVERKVPSKAAVSDPFPAVNIPPQVVDEGTETTELELQSDATASISAKESMNSQVATGLEVGDDEEIRLEEAATKAQAAFRGYLARRAFRTLKGIIRLQALIRGHLVRRQAVATLHCMQAIVKLQALARGRKEGSKLDDYSDSSSPCQAAARKELSGVALSIGSQKLASNAFVMKLLAKLPSAMPLSLQYDLAEPNSASNWLERWSSLRFWEPVALPKKNPNTKAQSKPSSSQEVETVKSKRTAKKAPVAASNDNIASNSSDADKPRRLKKVVSHQTESVPEQPQNELERVKRNLRKVSASTGAASEKSENNTEKAHDGPQKVPSSPAPDVSDLGQGDSSEHLTDSCIIVEKSTTTEDPPQPLIVDELIDVQHDDNPASQCLESGGEVDINPSVDGELNPKEDQTSKENQKTRRRSLPAKQEYPENVSQNTPSLPSYMAATESAKAKLRAQASPKLGEDGNGTENGSVRRHSLPSSTNGKASLSPRMHRPLQANGKGGNKNNKPLSSSRDDKILQPGWKR